ncbi:MAG: S-layer protein [Candidatus Diapherotrites archaeon]|nr:S-layer protein [Candidatus Diapherotrites archaeon]
MLKVVVFLADFVEFERNAVRRRIATKIAHKASEIRPLASDSAWKIYSELVKKPAYPAELAKKLGMPEQKAYYYINQLKKSGLVSVQKTQEKQGALAKFFSADFGAVSIVTPDAGGEKQAIEGREKEVPKEIAEFLEPFIHKGVFSAKIIIGSPDPHGPLKARARDSHLAVELAAILGSYASKIKYPFVLLDTMVESLEKLDSNAIIVGGPITNKICQEINDRLPVKFVQSNGPWGIESSASEKTYTEDATGIIVKAPHPFFGDKRILLIAGNRNAGTKAAVVAMAKSVEKIAKPNLFNERIHAKVVEGLDLDGDGQIDAAEIKE